MQEFICQTRIVMGTNAVSVLSELEYHRLFVVADPYFSKNGWAERIGKLSQHYEISRRKILFVSLWNRRTL